MKYNDFLLQKSMYDSIIEDRLDSYLQVAQTEKRFYLGATHSKGQVFKPNSSATNYLTESTNNEYIDYDVEITLEFDIDYSGCGTDTHTIILPEWILLESDDEYNTALSDYKDVLHDKNQEVDFLIKEQEDKETKVENKVKTDKDRKEYERLKKMFG